VPTSDIIPELAPAFDILPLKAEPPPEFKTAEELGLEQRNYDALVKTYCLLDNNKLTHAQVSTNNNTRTLRGPVLTGHFNMAIWRGEYRLQEENVCGTVCCIGGTAEALGASPFGRRGDRAGGRAALHKLFYGTDDHGVRVKSLYDITPRQARAALYNYFTTGDPNWRKAIKT
jgi:hypothetical protein